ncbi:peptidoglycan D,D-transpeptidase FtsI family protein [Candidatus Margulisiibacteriota bacterium]
MDKRRNRVFIYGFVLFGLLFMGALFKIQILDYDFYKQKAETQQRRFIKVAADRGDIISSDGKILATSLNTYSIYVNPRLFKDRAALSSLLGEEVKIDNSEKYFVWVRRKLNQAIAQQVKEAELPGVGIIVEKKRIYPYRQLASQVLGFTGIDNDGLAGLELSFDNYLKAKEGWIKTYTDPIGFEFLQAKRERVDPAEEGFNLVITIDHKLQYIAERELEKTIKKYYAKSGTVLVMDIKNGDILALASKPDFDPNRYYEFDNKLWISRACSVYEPGSTFKLITTAAAFEEGVADEETRLKALEKITVGGKTVTNAHDIDWPGRMTTVTFMLEQSTNTGAVQLGKMLGKEKFYKHIKKFGFGDKTEFGLPGESAGILKKPNGWWKPDIAMISFGQGIAVTPVQLIRAIAALGNDGKLINPRIIKRIESRDGSYIKSLPANNLGQATSKKTARRMLELMRRVIENGTGKLAALKQYKVGGKTGTAQKVIIGRGKYYEDRYIASFIGVAPIENPRFAALVIIDDPKGKIWGGTTAGPVFKRLVEETLRFYNIRPNSL